MNEKEPPSIVASDIIERALHGVQLHPDNAQQFKENLALMYFTQRSVFLGAAARGFGQYTLKVYGFHAPAPGKPNQDLPQEILPPTTLNDVPRKQRTAARLREGMGLRLHNTLPAALGGVDSLARKDGTPQVGLYSTVVRPDSIWLSETSPLVGHTPAEQVQEHIRKGRLNWTKGPLALSREADTLFEGKEVAIWREPIEMELRRLRRSLVTPWALEQPAQEVLTDMPPHFAVIRAGALSLEATIDPTITSKGWGRLRG